MTTLEIIAEILKEDGIAAEVKTYLHNSLILNETHQLIHDPRTETITLLNLTFPKQLEQTFPDWPRYELSDPKVFNKIAKELRK